MAWCGTVCRAFNRATLRPTPHGPSCSPNLYATPRSTPPAAADLQQDRRTASRTFFSFATLLLIFTPHFTSQELLKHWMKDHSLRGLHGAQHFAESTASLFSALYQRFDFQVDNIRLGADLTAELPPLSPHFLSLPLVSVNLRTLVRLVLPGTHP